MNKSIFSLVLALGLSIQAQAFDVFGYVKTYAVPCLATIGVSVAFSKKDEVLSNAMMGCSLVVIGGELVRPYDDNKRLKEMNEEFAVQMEKARKNLSEQYEDRLKGIDSRITDESVKNNNLIKSISLNVSKEMERDIVIALQEKMKQLDFLPDIEAKMIQRIKMEVVAELKTKEDAIISETVEKVIKRVTAEPVVVPKKGN